MGASSAHSTSDHFILQQAAFKRAVEQRSAARRSQVYTLWQKWIGGDDIGLPSAEFLLEHVSQPGIEIFHLLLSAHAVAIRRIGYNNTGWRGCRNFQDICLFQRNDFGEPGGG